MYIILSAISFGLTLFTYHPFLIFTPLFILLIFIIFKKKLNKKSILSGALVFSFFVFISLFSLTQGSGQKLSGVGVFGNENIIYNRAEIFRTDKVEPLIISKLLYNKYTITPYHISQNYLLTFSPKFLFDGETTKNFYKIGGFGYMYLFDALFILIGIIGLIRKKEKYSIFLFGWILISPIPSAITSEAPSVSRLIQLNPPLLILSAYGFYELILYLKKYNFYKLIIGFIFVLYSINFIYFLDQYFLHMNYHRAKFLHYGYKQVVEITNEYPDKKVVMTGPDNFPYISFLFHNKYDPNKFRKEVKYYKPESNGLIFVKSFGRYNFVKKIDRTKLNEDTIYIDIPYKKDKNTINFPSGEPIFTVIIK